MLRYRLAIISPPSNSFRNNFVSVNFVASISSMPITIENNASQVGSSVAGMVDKTVIDREATKKPLRARHQELQAQIQKARGLPSLATSPVSLSSL